MCIIYDFFARYYMNLFAETVNSLVSAPLRSGNLFQ